MDPSEEHTASSPEGRAAGAAEAMRQAAESRAERPEGTPEDKKLFDDAAKNDLAEAFKIFSPAMNEGALIAHANTTGDMYNAILQVEDPATVENSMLDGFAAQLKSIGLKRDPDDTPEEDKIAPKIVGGWFSGLTLDQQEYVISKLDQMSTTERDDPANASTEEEIRNLEAVTSQAEKARTELQNTIEQEMIDAEGDEERISKLQGYQKRAEDAQSRLHRFLHPEDPAKTWLKRGGKLGGYILLAMFIGLILELHWLHNAAKTK